MKFKFELGAKVIWFDTPEEQKARIDPMTVMAKIEWLDGSVGYWACKSGYDGAMTRHQVSESEIIAHIK